MGPQGPQGPQGEQGPAGPSGWTGVVLRTVDRTIQPGGAVDGIAQCFGGEVLLSGGYELPNYSPEIRVRVNAPCYQVVGTNTISGWRINVSNNLSEQITVKHYAYCKAATS